MVAVKAGDVVMEFDPADQQYALEQARTDLAEAEQEIVKMKADREVQIAQDAVDLMTARFDVRRAELDAQGNEFISPIDAQKNVLSLEEARRRLAQLEEDVKSRSVTSQASLQVVEEICRGVVVRAPGGVRLVAHVGMRVDHRRHDRLAGNVNHGSAGWRRCLLARPDAHDAAVLHHEPAVLDRRAAGAVENARAVENGRG